MHRGEVNCPLRTYNMKIGVIGFGAASIGFLSEVIDENHEIHILERSKDIFSSSISGIRSDGKIFVSDTMGGDMEIPLPIQKSVVDFIWKTAFRRQAQRQNRYIL